MVHLSRELKRPAAKPLTLHQLNTHPDPVEGCFGCKVATITFSGCFPTRSQGSGCGDATSQKKWDRELDRYADVRSQGIQPDGTTTDKIVAAEKKSETYGVPYGTDAYRQAVATRVAEKWAD